MQLEALCDIATAITAIVAIVLAMYTFWHQTQQNRTTLGITLIHDMTHKFFETAEFITLRRQVAKHIRGRRPGDPVPPEVYDLLDFFDTLGFYHRKGIADTEMTWTFFYYWVSNYCTVLTPEMNTFQEKHDGVSYHGNCPTLVKALHDFGVKHRGLKSGDSVSKQRQFEEFLRGEIGDPDREARATEQASVASEGQQ